MAYILDVSCLDAFSSGAKQRFIINYSNLIKSNKHKRFYIIHSRQFLEVKKILNKPNVFFIENPISQENYLIKLFSVIYIFFYIKIKFRKIKAIEYFTLPFLRIYNSKNIFTIHDLRKIYFSNFFLDKILLKFIFNYFLKKVDKIIVVSRSMRDEIINNFGKLDISIIYNTIDIKSFNKLSIKDINFIKKKYNLPKKFILSVGHLEKRKNYLRLIKAINILKKSDKNIRLIIIGQKADETDKINSLIKKLNLNLNIKILSNLDDFEVKCFYKSASLFVFPSTYEGFGIPILESMASDLPIVLSNTDVFREITENKFLYFDQYDPLSIANKIRFVLDNKKIQKQMVKYGKRRVNYFSVNNQSKKLNTFYNNLQ
jgi:glycosyltransferase involved in cell wall biosynthesis